MKYTELTPDEKTRYGQLFDQQLAAKGFVNPTQILKTIKKERKNAQVLRFNFRICFISRYCFSSGLFTTYFIHIMKSYKVYTDQKYYIDEYGCLCYDEVLSKDQNTVFEVTGMYLAKDMVLPSFEFHEL